MDTNEEERAKGKTVEVGRAHFESTLKRYAPPPAAARRRLPPSLPAPAVAMARRLHDASLRTHTTSLMMWRPTTSSS